MQPQWRRNKLHAKITPIQVLEVYLHSQSPGNYCKVFLIDADVLTLMLTIACLHMNTHLLPTIRYCLACDESTSWNQLRKQVKKYNIYWYHSLPFPFRNTYWKHRFRYTIVTEASNIRQPLKIRSKQPNSWSDTHTHTPISDQDNNMTRDIVILPSPPKNMRIQVRKTKKSIGEVSRTNKIFRQQLRKHDHIHGCNLLTSDSTSDTTISSCC